MRNLISLFISVITLSFVGITQDGSVIESMEKVEIADILIEDDSVTVLILSGINSEDVWVTIPNDNPVDPTSLKVGDTLSIYFNYIENSPLQIVAVKVEVHEL